MEVTYFSDHGYYGDWGEWEGQWKNDETYKVTREKKCLSKWSPKHDGVTCDPSESSEVSEALCRHRSDGKPGSGLASSPSLLTIFVIPKI